MMIGLLIVPSKLTWMEAGHGVDQLVNVTLAANAMLSSAPLLQVVAIVAAVLPVVIEISDDGWRSCRPGRRRHHPRAVGTIGPILMVAAMRCRYFSWWQLRWRRRHGQRWQRSSLLNGKRWRHVSCRSGTVAAPRI